MGKKIAGIGLVFILVVAGLAWYLLTNLNPIVKGAIEKYGSEITGAPVTVSAVDLSLKTGSGTIRGVSIGNPEGFSGKPTFELGEVAVSIDIGSLSMQPTVINTVLIDGPKVNVVANAEGKTNIDAIKKNIDNYSASKPKKGTHAPDKPGPGADKAQPLLRIEQFTFENAALSANLAAVGGEEDYHTTMPALNFEDLGGESGGTPEQIGQQMMKVVTDAIALEVASSGANALIDRHLEGGAADAAKGAVRKFMELKGD